MLIQPFTISFAKEKINDLHYRIDHTFWPEKNVGNDWDTGTSNIVLRELVKYWRHEYDWFRHQSKLNELCHFRAFADGDALHFVHYKREGIRQPFPILLLHGWPGSFIQYAKAASLLAEGFDNRPGFDLVVPSLPGFIFSEVAGDASLYYKHIAKQMHRLMKNLGYERFAVSGGDWGWIIAREIALLYPESVAGLQLEHQMLINDWHTNINSFQEQQYASEVSKLKATGMGYNQIQSTKPQTLAYALQDSPVGFLSWILEKFWAWSDHKGDLWAIMDRDFVLNTAMLYWLSGSILTSAKIYYINNRKYGIELEAPPIAIPTMLAIFPGDPFECAPESFADKSKYSNLSYVRYKKGGHFPSLEQPDVWARGLFEFLTNGIQL